MVFPRESLAPSLTLRELCDRPFSGLNQNGGHRKDSSVCMGEDLGRTISNFHVEDPASLLNAYETVDVFH